MKKLGYLILGIIIGVLGGYFYQSQNQNNHVKESSPDIVKPKGLISPSEAKALDQGFNSRHKLISDSIVKRPDNRSSWYSLEDITNYLKYADSQATSQGYKMDGIRVYLGAHKKVDTVVGYTTMFFVPTGYKNIAEGSSSPFATVQKSSDLTGGSGLNGGDPGNPPSANYPQ